MQDQELDQLLQREDERYFSSIDLIAAHNAPSPSARSNAHWGVAQFRSTEGLAGRRPYAGTESFDAIEQLAACRGSELFRAEHCNVQPVSGTNANLAVYQALLNPGDKILSMSLESGGHLSHGHPLHLVRRLYEISHYSVDPETCLIDYDRLAEIALKVKPRLIITGYSSYPRAIDLARFAQIGEMVGARVMADISHIAGIVAARLHDNPVHHGIIVASSVEKTLRGTRGGFILCGKDLAQQIDRGVFPGLQGSIGLSQLVATAHLFCEASSSEFREYQCQVLKHARALAEILSRHGIPLVGGGTDTHMVLVNVGAIGLSGKEAEERLARIGILTNRNVIPFDPKPPFQASGLRIGTSAITGRGYTDAEVNQVGELVAEALVTPRWSAALESALCSRVAGLVAIQRDRDNLQDLRRARSHSLRLASGSELQRCGTVGEILVRNARFLPNKIGIVCGETRASFREMNLRVNALAHGLLSLGVRQGDRVGILAHNCHRFLESYFAIAKTGGIVVPLNNLLSVEELAAQVNDCLAKIVIVGDHQLEPAQAVRSRCPGLETLIFWGEGQPSGVIDYESMLAGQPTGEPHVSVSPNDRYAILYTSGSTGRPKGAVITHRAHTINALSMIIEGDVREQDVTLSVLPMFAAIPEQMIPHLTMGARVVAVPRYEIKTMLETIARERVTHTDVVPTILGDILAYPRLDECDTSSLRHVLYGSAPTPPAVIKRWCERLPHAGLFEGYGTLESGPLAACLKPQDQLVKLGSAGKPVLQAEMAIVDEQDRQVPAGEVGEVVWRSESLFEEYYGQPEETARALRSGWFHSGDIGTLDAEGYLYILDRIKDLIKTGGLGVSSVEVERVLYEHPAVLEAAVIGIPHERWGEAIHAVVVKSQDSLTADELIQFCGSRLTRFKIPKSVEFVDCLPKTSIGKISKRALRSKYWAGREKQV
ncbi:MAG: long-chain-fatty-acid--CoA ligase [Chloroflexi bacterium]|nr:long-chain-fatty-acid--CoA ligase [Chloroflexota bacterium]